MTTDISTTEASLAERQLVVFSLHNELYGVDINVVREIIRMQSLTNVPETSSYVEGVFNLRGSVTPVIDLRKRLDLIVNDVTSDTRIVVVDVKNQNIGVIVDRVDEVLRIKADSIEPTPSIITATDSDYILGIAKREDRLIILLDLENALSEEALEIGRQQYLEEKRQKALNLIEAVLEEIVSREDENDEGVSEDGEPLVGRATLSVFYGRLLEAYPEIKPFFTEMNMKEAGTDLMEFLKTLFWTTWPGLLRLKKRCRPCTNITTTWV